MIFAYCEVLQQNMLNTLHLIIELNAQIIRINYESCDVQNTDLFMIVEALVLHCE